MDDTAVAAGYIIVFQDVRGKYGSEGDYVMTRPLKGPLNPTDSDHATDTYDTIDWLVKNIPESNGRVGDDRRFLRGVHDSHVARCIRIPRSEGAVPFAPMVDGWMGDDWFHNGAFRQDGTLQYIYDQEATREERFDVVVGLPRYVRGISSCRLGGCDGEGARAGCSSDSGASSPRILPMTATGRDRRSTRFWRRTRRKCP